MQDNNHAIHIFRPGRHTSMQGATIDFGEGDLIATAKAYDPTRHEAPLVIGHPRADAPAWGWVGGLTADEGGLFQVQGDHRAQGEKDDYRQQAPGNLSNVPGKAH